MALSCAADGASLVWMITRVTSGEFVELARLDDNFEARARPWEFWGAAKLANGAIDALTIATMITRAIRRDMAILLKALGDEFVLVMPFPISMPVTREENIIPNADKSNYLFVYASPRSSF